MEWHFRAVPGAGTLEYGRNINRPKLPAWVRRCIGRAPSSIATSSPGTTSILEGGGIRWKAERSRVFVSRGRGLENFPTPV